MASPQRLVTFVIVIVVTLVHQADGQRRIISFTGRAGQPCVTSSGFLGSCVSASSCRIDGATSDGCPRPTVCCLRVSSTSNAQRQTPRPTARPAVVRPTPARRRLCTYRVPVTSSASSVGLLARSGRFRRSPQRSLSNVLRPFLRPDPRPKNPPTRKPEVEAFYVGGGPVKGPGSQGTGLIGTGPRPRPVNLNSVLSRIRQRPSRRPTAVVTANRPVAPSRRVSPNNEVVPSRRETANPRNTLPRRNTKVEYRTYVAPC